MTDDGLGDDGFGTGNLPYGVDDAGHVVVPWHGEVIDLCYAVGLDVGPDVWGSGSLNAFFALGPDAWSLTRAQLQAGVGQQPARARRRRQDVRLVLPWDIGDYADFYASREHAANMGRLLRPHGDPLPPAWCYLPMGYHGRAGTVVVSGSDVPRPAGLLGPGDRAGGRPEFGPSARAGGRPEFGPSARAGGRPEFGPSARAGGRPEFGPSARAGGRPEFGPSARAGGRPEFGPSARAGGRPEFGPSARLDVEVELGFVVGVGVPRGQAVPIDHADRHVFGVVLVNDWSARDIQAFEYQPLGPFLGKSFATSVSPWVVPLAAFEPWKVNGPAQEPEPAAYLKATEPRGLDIHLQLAINDHVVSTTTAAGLYWSMAQQLAHLTVNGSGVRSGDLFASGTISGPTPGTEGSLMELTSAGQQPLRLPDGTTRAWLADGDRVSITGWCGSRPGPDWLSLGEVAGQVLPYGREVATG